MRLKIGDIITVVIELNQPPVRKRIVKKQSGGVIAGPLKVGKPKYRMIHVGGMNGPVRVPVKSQNRYFIRRDIILAVNGVSVN